MPYKEKTILGFIDRFTQKGTDKEVIRVFTQGCCYWFARILLDRFPMGHIVYDPVENHFACRISGQIYDITGIVANPERFVLWETYPDPIERRRIVRDCIDF